MDTLLINLSMEQRIALNSMFAECKNRGSIMAQVYPDGMRVRLLTPAMTAAVAKVFGLLDNAPTATTAREAHKQSEGTL